MKEEKELVCIKLITGNELIGLSNSDMYNDEIINIEDPLEVFQYPSVSQKGFVSILYPFMAYSAENIFTFKQKNIITYCRPSQDLVEYYNKIMSTENDNEESGLTEEQREALYRILGANTSGGTTH